MDRYVTPNEQMDERVKNMNVNRLWRPCDITDSSVEQ